MMDSDRDNSPSSCYTAASSPISSMAIVSTTGSSARASEYRPAVPVSQEIASLCHIYFDEKLYLSALNLISSLVTSGASQPNLPKNLVFAPLPLHIEAVSILLVHPEYTTQSAHNERAELASRSIAFLRSILSIIGPLNANLAEAFSFTHPRPRGRRRHVGEDASSSDDEEEVLKMKGVIMNSGRIRTCATDFWHVVGWALNCSVVHRKRWKHWKVWLNYMLDVLDRDWNEREARDQANQTAEDTLKMRRDSLLASYLSSTKGRSSALKRVVGSAFVDGGFEDLRAYPEVFKNETLEQKAQNSQKRKREDDFGSYNDDEEGDFEFDSEAPAASQETDDGDYDSTLDPWLGGPESINTRQRILTLLSRAVYYLPEEFGSLHDLYGVYCNNLKSLPLPAFSLLMSPSASSQLLTAVYVSLSQIFLGRILSNSAPRPRAVSGRSSDDLSQDILEECFLPFAANTSSAVDNAKVSILAESMLRLLHSKSRVCYSPKLQTTIEAGIRAREAKCKTDRRKKEKGVKRGEEEDDRKWLIESGKRLRSLLRFFEQHQSNDAD